MEFVCPVCNGYGTLQAVCPHCGQLMGDGGTPAEWVGPYSPYESTASAPHQPDTCVHVLFCPHCGQRSHAIVQNDAR